MLEREVAIPDVAAAHARALDAQIRVLRLQRAVLTVVARRESDPEEMQTMHRLAQLSDDERRRIVAEFLDEAFAGLDIEPEFEARMRSARPELPADPTPEQIEAAVELGELLENGDFRATIRRMSERHAAERYRQLLAVINGWPPVPTTVPAWEWLIAALPASSEVRNRMP